MTGKATVPIYYESRIAKLGLNASELPKLDAEFEEITESWAIDTCPLGLSHGRARAGVSVSHTGGTPVPHTLSPVRCRMPHASLTSHP